MYSRNNGSSIIRIASGFEIATFIPTLGAFVMGIFRIMPSISKASSRINNIVFSAPGLDNTYEIIMEEKKIDRLNGERDDELKNSIEEKNIDNLSLNYEIFVDNIKWRYEGSTGDVLKGLSLRIKKGESVAFIGTSGGGKSTLADIKHSLYLKKQKVYL